MIVRTLVVALAAIAFAPALSAGPRLPGGPAVVLDPAIVRVQASSDLQSRLRDAVHNQGGVLVIRERGNGGLSVAPPTIPWIVDCGDAGVSVGFGAGTGDTENGVSVQLSPTAMSDDQCQQVAPAIGQTLMAITRGQ